MKTRVVTIHMAVEVFDACVERCGRAGIQKDFTVSDFINSAVCEALNHSERSSGRKGMYHHVAGDLRVGRPRKKS